MQKNVSSYIHQSILAWLSIEETSLQMIIISPVYSWYVLYIMSIRTINRTYYPDDFKTSKLKLYSFKHVYTRIFLME